LFSAAEGLSLTDASTAGSYRDRVVRHSMIRGEPAIGHEQSHVRHACIRSLFVGHKEIDIIAFHVAGDEPRELLAQCENEGLGNGCGFMLSLLVWRGSKAQPLQAAGQ
jgi:hypothetical protein